MRRSLSLAAAILAGLLPSIAMAGGDVGPGEEVILLEGYPGGLNPLARGALYNTPPSVSFASVGYGRRHHRGRHPVIRVRY